ncbi:HtaA domain-containing protein [Leifsonia sp. Leaf264]|uniref:HtaA domain-containing protein n=1 Tax=Leifsonia sp. Leaf264 TaxID=1736314 RepID=UPI0006F2DB19|nr:HtaA domain-containing protein [Leifsonia sp. Leaf264]KQO97770.1 hypothetical protein ASF30_15420 [Leifsonia sp. Leaf264]
MNHPHPPSSTYRRILAALTVTLLAAGGVFATGAPALADDIVAVSTPAATAEPTATPTSEPATEPTAEPAPDAAPEATPAPEAPAPEAPTPEAPAQTAAPSPEPSSEPAPAAESPAPTPAATTTPAPKAQAAPLAAVAAAPVITATQAPASGGTITVTGSGFAGVSPGIYLGLGPVGLAGFYAGSSSLVSSETVWIAVGNPQGESGAGKSAPMQADGTFSLTVTVPAPSTATPAYALYTSKAHGQGFSDPSQNTITPVAYAPAPLPTPTVTVSKTTNLNPDGDTVTVRGTGFVPNAPTTSGTRPPLAGKFTGAYVTFGRFADVWKPTENAATSARVGLQTYWAVNAADMATIGGPAAGAIEIEPDGTFEVEVPVSAVNPKDPGTGNYGIYTYPGGGAKYAAFETATALTFAEKLPTPTVTVSKTTNLNPDGDTVTVSGTGFVPNAPTTSGTRPPLAGKFTGAYVTFGRFADVWKPTENATTSARVGLQTYWAVNAADMATIGGPAAGAIEIGPDGTFEVEVPVSAVNSKDPGTGNYGIYTYPGGGAKYAAFETYTQLTFADPTPEPEPDVDTTTTLAVSKTVVTAGGTVTLTATVTPAAASGTVAFFDGSTPLGGAVAVKDGVATTSVVLSTVGAASLTAQFVPAVGYLASTSAAVVVTVSSVVVPPVTPTEKGSLTWGIDADFRAYVTGPIASGSVTPGAGATAAGGAFSFAQSGGTFDGTTGRGTAEYAGSVRFTGHSGALDLTVGDPILRVTSATAGVLSVTVNGARVDFGTVDLKAATRSTVTGATVFTDAPVTLTTAGAVAFNGFYPAGRSLSPLTAVIGAAVVTPEPPTDPVATTTTLAVSKTSVTAGASVTLTAKVAPTKATGFVTFISGGKAIGTPVALSSGSAKTTVKLSTVGTNTFTARFAAASGAAFAVSSSSGVTVTVTSAVTPPVAPTTPPVSDPTSTGSLRWGIDSSFRSYVTGPIAQGAIAVSGGATSDGGVFQFGQSGGSFDQASNSGTADYSGAVRFTGHSGALDLTFSAPILRVTDSATGVLSVSVNGSRVDFGAVDLGAASRSTAGGATTFASAPVTLTSAGAAAFDGFYSAGRSLAPLTAVIGATGAAPAGTGGTVASAPAAAAASVTPIPSTPPATTGIELDDTTLTSLVNGEEVTITVTGFEPNETGITVVIYSTPTVLARDLTADATGAVTWTGTLPASLTGTHTLTFQGSTAKGIVLTIPERTAVAGQCTVTDATLDWGFKESFRGYLTGGIANGDWILTGVTEENGVFSWTGGTGSVDASATRGLVGFTGAIEFSGHGGALDTTVANPRIELAGPTEGYLLLDVTGTTQQGEPVTAAGIRFASLDLSADALTTTDAAITGTAIPAVLTEEGAAAFGTYPAGEELDPVSFTAPLPADCGAVAATADEPVAEATDGDVAAAAAAAAAAEVEPVSDSGWWIWAVVALIVIAAIVVAVILRRRAVVAARAAKQ